MNDTEKEKLEKNQKRRSKTNDKKKKKTSTKITKVGQAKYINQLTGEAEVFNIIEEHDQDFNFEKIWLGHLLESLDVLGNAKIKVLNYLLANKNNDNQIIATQRAIALGVGVSLPVVNETIQKLKSVKAITEVQRGVLMLNPEIVFKGNHKKRMNILLRFNKTKTIDEEKNKEAPKETETKKPDQLTDFPEINEDE